jgi:hypothetical protein
MSNRANLKQGQKDSQTRVCTPLIFMQVACFAILYAIWALPSTIALRNICLVLGALASIYPVYQARHYFLQKTAIPVWLLSILFLWAVFHLLFLAQNFVLQYEEFTSIWKRTFIGAIFALGFGINMAGANNVNLERQNNGAIDRSHWFSCNAIAYLGLFSPTAIYIIKYFLAESGLQYTIPIFLQPYIGENSYYIAKTAYMCFCLPMFAAGLALLYSNLIREKWYCGFNLVYLLSIVGVIFVFNGENIKNGFIYSFIFVVIFIFLMLTTFFKTIAAKKVFLVVLFGVISTYLIVSHINKNESWRSFFADTKIALKIYEHQHWKFGPEYGFPINHFGQVVSTTNYERISWAKVGVILATKNPLGYGLIERSFGHLAYLEWPETSLTQSHSGWIDLTLGLGVIGLTSILAALLFLLNRLRLFDQRRRLALPLLWILLANLLMWCTTELSQKIYFENLIFWLSFGAGYSLVPDYRAHKR